jgi:hypothetical protein
MNEQPETYEFTCHVFGAVCSPSCATYALLRTAKDNAGKYHTHVLHEIERFFYVDDYLSSVDDEVTAIRYAEDLVKITATGGFKLTKWVSNSKRVLEAVSSLEGVSTEVDLDMDDGPTSRVLGVQWRVKDDVITFKRKSETSDTNLVSKRTLLSLVCSIFDPLGILAPFLVRARILIQTLWQMGVEWDTTLGSDIAALWAQLIAELDMIEEFRVMRKYWPPRFEPIHTSLHVFGDSSEKAYAAVCYIRVVSYSGEIHVSYVMSRMRVAPTG